MPELDEQHSQVVYKQQGIHHRTGVLHHIIVLNPSLLLPAYPHRVEQPEGKAEDEDQNTDGAAVQEDPWQGCLARPEEHCPAADEQNQQAECEADEQAVALDVAPQLTLPEGHEAKLGYQHHEDGAEEGGHREHCRRPGPHVSLACERPLSSTVR